MCLGRAAHPSRRLLPASLAAVRAALRWGAAARLGLRAQKRSPSQGGPEPRSPPGLCSSPPNWFVGCLFPCLHRRRSPALGEEPPRNCSLAALARPGRVPSSRPDSEHGASARRDPAGARRPAGTSLPCSRGRAKAPRAGAPPAELPLSSQASKCGPSPRSKLSWDPGGR